MRRPGPWLLTVFLALAGCGAAREAPRSTAVLVGPGPRTQVVAPRPANVPLRELPRLAPLTSAESAALDVLLARLRDGATDERPATLEEIAKRFGGRGLVRALRRSVPSSPPEARWFRTEQLMSQLDLLADPGAADDLAAYVAESDDEHFRGRAAFLLAKLGDARAAEALARRLRHPPERVYDPARFWESGPSGHLARTDQARIEAARALVDLAILHPDRRAHLAQVAEEAVTAWALDRAWPHANAMRFLGQVRAERARPQLRRWALPDDALPEPGAQPPFPAAFEVAQSALRALGLARDGEALPDLERQLLRKEEGADIRMETLTSQPIAMRGMALRALGFGASQGLSELGDPRAAAALERVVRDPLHNEEVRGEACEALPWCMSDPALAALGDELPKRAASTDPVERFRAACLLSALARRAPPQPSSAWLAVAHDPTTPVIAILGAALLAVAGAGASDATLSAWLGDPAARPVAAAVLVLVGNDRSAKAAGAAGEADPRAAEKLREILDAIGVVTEAHLDRGALLRWGKSFRSAGEPAWARVPLEAFFEAAQLDRGPHSLDRVVLRRRLVEIAAFGEVDERAAAKTVLSLMKERGALDYLSRLPP